MTILEAFLLEAYCNVTACTASVRITAKTRVVAYRNARKQGWTLNAKRDRALCPSHKHYRDYVTNAEARARWSNQ